VRCGFPSNPVISFSAAKYLAFSVRHDDINGPICIPLAGYTNNLVRGEHVIFIFLSCILAAALLKFFWVQLSDSISSLTEITQRCIHMCNGLFICQLYSLPNLLKEMDCKEDTPLMLPFCIIRFLLTVDNSDMN
jgi:hypothetical protein